MTKERRFVRAIAGPKNSVIYFTDEGHRFQYVGGTRTWRNQNPGNMVVGKVSRRNGLVGTAGRFAVFPGYETGHTAHRRVAVSRALLLFHRQRFL